MLIHYELAVFSGGVCCISDDISQFWEMLDQSVEFSCVSSFPWGDSETMDDTRVDIDADMEFDAVSSASSSFDSYLVPGASVMGAESTAVNSDVHSFPSEDAGYSVHDLTDVFDRKFVHISVYDTMAR